MIIHIPIYLFLVIIDRDYLNFISKISLICFLCLVLYMRFVERNIIKINKHKLSVGISVKIIVISDLHLGVYKDEKFLEKVVEKINNIKDVEMVLIAGDFVYFAKDRELEKLFKPLSEIKRPVYAVTGNHDDSKKEPTSFKKIKSALIKSNVIILEEDFVKLKENVFLTGVSEKTTKNYRKKVKKLLDENKKVILLTHNPDTSLEFSNMYINLIIAGHTHGGQIRIPFIYKKMIPCRGKFDKGVYKLGKESYLFISSGLGEGGLPLRLGVAPSIDVLDLE